jgi:hypothetical protein
MSSSRLICFNSSAESALISAREGPINTDTNKQANADRPHVPDMPARPSVCTGTAGRGAQVIVI